MLTVGLIAFSLFRFVGDPVTFMLGQDATPEQRIEVTRALGLDRYVIIQKSPKIHLTSFGYTFEDQRMLMTPMARDGVEAPLALPAVEAAYAPFPDSIDPRLKAALEKRGVTRT